MLISASFGSANSGAEVGYTILSSDGNVFQARTTDFISESPVGSGTYIAIEPDTYVSGKTIIWDITGTSKTAIETYPNYINTDEFGYVTASNMVDAAPTTYEIAVELLANPDNKLLTDASGHVTYNNTVTVDIDEGAIAQAVDTELSTNHGNGLWGDPSDPSWTVITHDTLDDLGEALGPVTVGGVPTLGVHVLARLSGLPTVINKTETQVDGEFSLPLPLDATYEIEFSFVGAGSAYKQITI